MNDYPNELLIMHQHLLWMRNTEALAVIYCSHTEASLRQYRVNFSKIRQAEVYVQSAQVSLCVMLFRSGVRHANAEA